MTTNKEQRRIKIKYRVRNKISGTAECPRLTVFRSNKQIYVQIINDGKTNDATRTNPLLINAMETAAKLGHQLDELNVLVNRVCSCYQ